MTTTTLTDKLTAIADAIRNKTGTSDTMTLDTMAREISNINISTETDSAAGLISRSITKYSFDSLTSIAAYAFFRYTSLEGVDIPNVTSILTSTFNYGKGLTKVWIPSTCTTIYATSLGFYDCSTLEIYTDVEDEDSIPSGWGTYWNYCTSGVLTVHYGATHDEYEAA